jgi:Glycosyltransferase family 87
VIGGWYCLSRDHHWSGGILIGLAALVKMFPGLLFFWLLLRKRKAFMAGLATVFVVVLAVYLFRGTEGFTDYFRAVKAYEEQFGRGRQNYSLASVIPYLIAGPSAKSSWASATVLFADLALFVYTAYRSLQRPAPTGVDATLEFSSYLVLSFLLSPTVEAFYYPTLLLPIAAIAAVVGPTHLLRNTIWLVAILWCFSSPEQVIWRPTLLLAPLIGDRLSFLLFSFPTFAMLTLWYWSISRRKNYAGVAASNN